ncbi:MAG: ADP-ribosylglycohydrolase family protein, partial [Anaerolineae bacterium]
LAIVAATGGQLRPAMIAAVNYGRDTDCLAAVAGGLAGALSGADDLDPAWIAQVNTATKADPYTCSLLDIDETTEGLYRAVRSRITRQRQSLAVLEDAPEAYWG